MTPAIPKLQADLWIEQHATLCRRFQVHLSLDACKATAIANSERCQGCGGLDDQRSPVLKVVPDTLPHEPGEDTSLLIEAEPLADQAGEDLWVDLDEHSKETLLDLYPDLKNHLKDIFGAEEEDYRPRRTIKKPQQRAVAVSTGRCPRCGGYMINAIERQFSERDDEVYRCYGCSWRTSPVYNFNRRNLRSGR